MHKLGTKQVFNEINITPLTDIFLVLLIIMMVVAPMMQQNRADIKPPTLNSGSQVQQNLLTVEIDKGGALYVQGEATKADVLADALKTAYAKLPAADGQKAAPAAVSTADGSDNTTATSAASPDTTAEKNLVIRADKQTKSGEVLKVFEAARDAGFTKVTVAGEPLTDQRQTQLQSGDAGAPPVEQGGP